MRFLLCNDDGYRAPGLLALATTLRALGAVTVVAPERNRSGASNSLTLDRPLRATLVADGVFMVDGTPADCAYLALTELLPEKPDLVVSGINAGENLGDDVLYSGTVAAAMEGCLLGTPALAFSLASPDPTDYAGAARIAGELVQKFIAEGMPQHWLLNINIPNVPAPTLRDAQITRLGRRQRAAVSIMQRDPRGRPMYWIGPAGAPGAQAGPGTDFHAIAAGVVSITPLQMDLSAYATMPDLAQWLRN
ncbi:MAG: 5'/3'-nucleotidase SurE [Gammaproteobacteria bacterium]|nr:5'/3'-nucleotidase SurE [Gammaproteobacteria bacterium]